MSSQGSRGPHRWGSPLGAPVVLHSPLGQALTCGGLGAPQVFIPGFLKLLRFQAHHKHILSRALPKLKGHVVSPRPEVLSHGHCGDLASCRLHLPSPGGSQG